MRNDKMKIIVPVKRVIDPYVKIRIKLDGSGVDTHQVKMVMNPFDEIALEEALQLKEKGIAQEVVCVSIGDKNVQETLRHGLALGADKAFLIETDQTLNSLQVAKVLAKFLNKESADIVLMGKQSIDNDANQTPQMLAGLLDWPQATFISRLDYQNNKLLVTRETDLGLEEMELSLPAVISVDLRLNEPRYATLPNIMKAKAKPLTTLSLIDLGMQDLHHALVFDTVKKPQARQKGVMVADVSELLEKIRPILTS